MKLVKWEALASKEVTVMLERLASQVHWDRTDLQVPVESRVLKDPRERQELPVQGVWLEHLETLVPQARMATRVFLAKRVILEPKDFGE